MTLDPTPEVVGGWVVAFASCGSPQSKMGTLAACLDNVGPKGLALVLQKLQIETAQELVMKCVEKA